MTTKAIKPTESELEILQVLWDKNEATVREVHEQLGAHKDTGYTTTLKLMQIMHSKKMVSRNSSSKTHIYSSLLSKENTQDFLVNKLVQTVFNGSAAQLALNALGNHKPSSDEIEALEAYLKQHK